MNRTVSDARQVAAVAQIALLVLRDNGVRDDDILKRYVVPHVKADRAFEARQNATEGRVYAPAAAVKAEMRRLLTQ